MHAIQWNLYFRFGLLQPAMNLILLIYLTVYLVTLLSSLTNGYDFTSLHGSCITAIQASQTFLAPSLSKHNIKMLSSLFKHRYTQLAYQDYQGIQHTTPIQYYAMSSLEPPQDRFTLFKCIRYYSHIHFREPQNSTSQTLVLLK